MKTKIIFFLFVSLFANLMFAQKGSPIAQVKKIIKDVNVRTQKESDEKTAKIGESIFDGGYIKTFSKSVAVVLYTSDKSIIRVRENSVLNIYGENNKATNKYSRNTSIEKGSVSFDIQKQSANDEFKFTTPTAVASIRGTDGLIFCDSTVTRVYLENGEVYIESTTDPSKNGKIVGGEKISFNADGTMVITQLSEEDIRLIESAKTQTIKKVIIQTLFGTIEIEYYTSDQQ